uniref:Transmembrane 4 L six family member 20 n=1 Tax=Leptobrachium leishanense TaxID=445787 RepID=A0A8C5MFM1_9ANUR
MGGIRGSPEQVSCSTPNRPAEGARVPGFRLLRRVCSRAPRAHFPLQDSDSVGGVGRLLVLPLHPADQELGATCHEGSWVLPAVAMSLAARKKGSCNSRCGMLTSALLSILAIVGAAYCIIVSLFAIGRGPLICDTGSYDVNDCDYSLGNLSSFESIKFDLSWLRNASCLDHYEYDYDIDSGIMKERLFDVEIDEDTQKIMHLSVFMALTIIGLLEILTALFQIVAGLLGLCCGTSKKRQDDDDDDDLGPGSDKSFAEWKQRP